MKTFICCLVIVWGITLGSIAQVGKSGRPEKPERQERAPVNLTILSKLDGGIIHEAEDIKDLSVSDKRIYYKQEGEDHTLHMNNDGVIIHVH